MKYLKLFEDKDWWEEESPFDNLEDEDIKVGDLVVILIELQPMYADFLGSRKNSIGIVRLKQGIYYEVGVKGRFFVYKENEIRKLTKEEKGWSSIKEQKEEENWWEEESPFDDLEEDNKEIKAGDWVIVLNGDRKNLIGIVYMKFGRMYRIDTEIGPLIYDITIIRKLTNEEKKKFGIIKEQFNTWDPFGEEIKEIEVGDEVKIISGLYKGSIGVIVKKYPKDKKYFVSLGKTLYTFEEKEIRKLNSENLENYSK